MLKKECGRQRLTAMPVSYTHLDVYKRQVLPEVLEAEEYGIAFRKEEQSLADAVNQQLIAIQEDGTLDEIRSAWFANDVTIVADYADEYRK